MTVPNKENVKLSVASCPDEFVFEDAVQAYKDTMEGFTCINQHLAFKPHVFEDFLKEVEKEFGSFKKYNYNKNKNQIYVKYVSEECKIYLSGNTIEVTGNVLTKDEETNMRIWNIYKKYAPTNDEVDIYVHSYFITKNDLDENNKTMKPKDFDYISESYYPYIDTNVMFDQFFTGAENILLLVGEPGLGKSKFASMAIKHAYENPDKLPYDKFKDNPSLDTQFITVAFVKSPDVLAFDKFWRKLEQLQADFVIIDDLDYMLTKRDAEVMSQDDKNKNVFLNQFLSYTDGVEKHNTKFIITTNQTFDDIDTALLRKGRLFDILELRKLDREEAKVIWRENNLEEELFEEIYQSHDILPAELGSEINRLLNDRISNATLSYLKEDNISRIDKAGRAKNIGI